VVITCPRVVLGKKLDDQIRLAGTASVVVFLYCTLPRRREGRDLEWIKGCYNGEEVSRTESICFSTIEWWLGGGGGDD
jgi:hypothetical protein